MFFRNRIDEVCLVRKNTERQFLCAYFRAKTDNIYSASSFSNEYVLSHDKVFYYFIGNYISEIESLDGRNTSSQDVSSEQYQDVIDYENLDDSWKEYFMVKIIPRYWRASRICRIRFSDNIGKAHPSPSGCYTIVAKPS